MIKAVVDVESFCNSCPCFKPSVELYSLYGDSKAIEHTVDVSCEYHDQCNYLYRYIEKQVKKEKK